MENIKNSKMSSKTSKALLNNVCERSVDSVVNSAISNDCCNTIAGSSIIKDSFGLERINSSNLYTCSHCGFQTHFLNLLNNHKRKHNIRLPWACSKCKYSSTRKYTLERHLQLVHEKPQKIFCNECDFKCSRKIQLKRHMLIHSRSNYFQCSECDYKHTVQSVLKRHMIIHLDNRVNLQCSLCSYKGSKPEYLARHLDKHHRFELDLEKSFSNREMAEGDFDINSFTEKNSNLIRNSKQKILEKQPIVLLRRCDDNETGNREVDLGVVNEQVLQDNFFEIAQCGESEDIGSDLLNSKEESSMVVHKSILITKNKNMISSVIKVIEKNKSTKSLLPSKQNNLINQNQITPVLMNEVAYNSPNKTGNSRTENVYRCEECNFVSSWLDLLEKHVKVHRRECFYCDECDFITNSKSYLRRHKQLKHCQEKKFTCNKCDFQCSSSQYLKHHMITHVKAKKFSCQNCHMKCKTAEILKFHMKKHEEDKPFTCNLCDFRTRYRASLKKHMFVHTGETKHICQVCNYKYSTNSQLVKHMEVHTLFNK